MTEVLDSVRTKPACYGCIRTLLRLNNGTQKYKGPAKTPRELIREATAETRGSTATVPLPSQTSTPVSQEACIRKHIKIYCLWQTLNSTRQRGELCYGLIKLEICDIYHLRSQPRSHLLSRYLYPCEH